jgi:tRNA(His) 5'-end guanylyltransferase
MSIEANLKKLVTVDTTAKLNPRSHTIFRLDGVNFSRYFKELNLSKPYDDRITNSMIETGIECFNTCTFSLCYVGYGEITYYLKPVTKEEEDNGFEYDYGGRIQKMVSVLASKASTIFYSKLIKYFGLESLPKFYPYWECKITQTHVFDEVIENLNERIVSTLKNSRSLFVSTHLPGTELSSKDALKKILADKQIDFNFEVSDNNKVGCVITYMLTEFEIPIDFPDGQTKSIKFIKKTPICQNLNPLDVANIKQESLL